jgi:hypothetical protein
MKSFISSMVSTIVETTYLFFDAEALIIETRKETTVTVFCVNVNRLKCGKILSSKCLDC